MKVSTLSKEAFDYALATNGLSIKTGPFVSRIQSPLPAVQNNVYKLYYDHEIDDTGFADFPVSIQHPKSPRRWYRPQILFRFNGTAPFKPLPESQAYPALEWGLNWTIAMHAHQFLVIHAAVVAKGNHAVILPGSPGAGKSTLCAGLISRGWRLLSDELTLISTRERKVHPLVRPINLKNDSIGIIRDFNPDAVFSDKFVDTLKGTVALVKPPVESVTASELVADPIAVVFPKYVSEAATEITEFSKARTTLELAEQTFNFGVLGEHAFNVITDMVDDCACLKFEYSDLDDGIRTLHSLVANASI